MSPSDIKIKHSLADALAHRLYDAHCEWMMNVFMAGQQNIVFPVWWMMDKEEKDPYLLLALDLLEKDHIGDKAKRV